MKSEPQSQAHPFAPHDRPRDPVIIGVVEQPLAGALRASVPVNETAGHDAARSGRVAVKGDAREAVEGVLERVEPKQPHVEVRDPRPAD
jgi:hypothetical protein